MDQIIQKKNPLVPVVKRVTICLSIIAVIGLQYCYIFFDHDTTEYVGMFIFKHTPISKGTFSDYIFRDASYVILIALVFNGIDFLNRFKWRAVLLSLGYIIDFKLFYNDPIPGLWRITYGWVLAIASVWMFYLVIRNKNGN